MSGSCRDVKCHRVMSSVEIVNHNIGIVSNVIVVSKIKCHRIMSCVKIVISNVTPLSTDPRNPYAFSIFLEFWKSNANKKLQTPNASTDLEYRIKEPWTTMRTRTKTSVTQNM